MSVDRKKGSEAVSSDAMTPAQVGSVMLRLVVTKGAGFLNEAESANVNGSCQKKTLRGFWV
jgi:hypothetical protein